MASDALRTLFHPFDSGEFELLAENTRILFLGVEPSFSLPDGFPKQLDLIQGFRPWFNALSKAGHAVSPDPTGSDYAAALILATKHRGQNELRIADALRRTNAGALILVAGGKEDGIASLRKRVEAMTPLDGSLAKYHGVAFWFRRSDDPTELIAALEAGNADALVDARFITRPGMFSHDHIDAGSKLLSQHLPAKIKGAVADFCAGWGYLAAEVAARAETLTTLDLYEADHAALEAAKTNLARLAPDKPTLFFWHDLAAEPVTEKYDLIVMNPPFHAGRAAEPEIGIAIISIAAKALRPRGKLLIVANRGLPYEATLAKLLPKGGELAREGGFKVLWGER